MNNTLVGIIAFSAGAAIGAVITWKVLKTKYEQIAQEEIDSVKEVFAKRHSAEDEVVASKEEPEYPVVPRINILRDTYKEVVQTAGYILDEEDNPLKPYVIQPEEFATLDDYDVVCLTHYTSEPAFMVIF